MLFSLFTESIYEHRYYISKYLISNYPQFLSFWSLKAMEIIDNKIQCLKKKINKKVCLDFTKFSTDFFSM